MSGRVRSAPAAPAAALPTWDVVGYRRVPAGEEAAGWKRSLDHQTEQIRALAARYGRALDPAAIFEDGPSGEAVAGRAGLRALLAYCRAHSRPADAPGLALFSTERRFGHFADPDEAAAIRFGLKRRGWVVRFAALDDADDATVRDVLRAIGGAGRRRTSTILEP